MASRFLAPLPTRGWLPEPLFQLQREIDRVFDDVFSASAGGGGSSRSSSSMALTPPRIDVKDSENELCVHADMPGVSANDLDVRVEGDVLTIRGERKSENERSEQNYHVMERSHGRFQRSLQLPFAPDPQQVQASMRDGVLEVHIPKRSQQERSRRIQVRDAGAGGASAIGSNGGSGSDGAGASGGSSAPGGLSSSSFGGTGSSSSSATDPGFEQRAGHRECEQRWQRRRRCAWQRRRQQQRHRLDRVPAAVAGSTGSQQRCRHQRPGLGWLRRRDRHRSGARRPELGDARSGWRPRGRRPGRRGRRADRGAGERGQSLVDRRFGFALRAARRVECAGRSRAAGDGPSAARQRTARA